MMHYSKTAGYAIHALSCIGAALPKASLIRDVAGSTGLKKPYLAKIINQLAHHGFIKAKRGYRGGIMLARPPEAITLQEIVESIEGEAQLGPCLFGLDECPALGQCPAHALWGKMGKEIESALRKTTLQAIIAVTPLRAPRRRLKEIPKRKAEDGRRFACPFAANG